MTLELALPTSKSMTQRALVLAALAHEPSTLLGPLECDDARHLRRLLEAFGATFQMHEDGKRLDVTPAAVPLRAPAQAIACGNAGTAIRFGAALSLLADGPIVLDGDEHMRTRPIGPLADALRLLGVEAEFLRSPRCPPLRLERTAAAPAKVTVDTTVSSQFASALLLVAPRLPEGLELELTGSMVSRPYLAMTVAMLQNARVNVAWREPRVIRVYPGAIAGTTTTIEVDWSAAAFLLAAAAITGADIAPRGLVPPEASTQGDAAIVGILEQLDTAAENTVCLHDCPDLLAPVTVAALFARKPTRIRGAAHARVKECDRIAVLAREFGKVGAALVEHPDGLDVEPLSGATTMAAGSPVWLDPSDDHRMAMAFGVASLRLPSIAVRNEGCVSKSFPHFWESLARIREHLSPVTRP